LAKEGRKKIMEKGKLNLFVADAESFISELHGPLIWAYSSTQSTKETEALEQLKDSIRPLLSRSCPARILVALSDLLADTVQQGTFFRAETQEVLRKCIELLGFDPLDWPETEKGSTAVRASTSVEVI
jgi:hypothetical protein